MGLDITAYRKLEVVENPKYDEYGELENWDTEWKPGSSMEWAETYFPGRAEGLDSTAVYRWSEKEVFRAGSYSGYNWWREKLAEFSGKAAFQELINFSDCEGCIGSVVSKKLFQDFQTYESKAKGFSEGIENGKLWFEKYLNWKEAFEMAADGGAVDFH